MQRHRNPAFRRAIAITAEPEGSVPNVPNRNPAFRRAIAFPTQSVRNESHVERYYAADNSVQQINYLTYGCLGGMECTLLWFGLGNLVCLLAFACRLMVLTLNGGFALDGVSLFFDQPKKSNQKKGCPSHFFILYRPTTS